MEIRPNKKFECSEFAIIEKFHENKFPIKQFSRGNLFTNKKIQLKYNFCHSYTIIFFQSKSVLKPSKPELHLDDRLF